MRRSHILKSGEPGQMLHSIPIGLPQRAIFEDNVVGEGGLRLLKKEACKMVGERWEKIVRLEFEYRPKGTAVRAVKVDPTRIDCDEMKAIKEFLYLI